MFSYTSTLVVIIIINMSSCIIVFRTVALYNRYILVMWSSGSKY